MNAKILHKKIVRIVSIVWLIGATNVNAALATVVLTGDTSRPESSTFAAGETVKITFDANGLSAHIPLTLAVNVFDDAGNRISHWQCPVSGNTTGAWQTTWTAPSAKLGFYRVDAALSDGTEIAGLGSRPNGYLTYCVVPNPSLRVTPTEENAHFGMQGGFNSTVNVLPYLGIRWVLSDYNWSQMEPTQSGQFEANVLAANAKGHRFPAVHPEVESVSYNGQPWQVYTIATLNSIPAWATVGGSTATDSTANQLMPAGQTAWASYCTSVAKDYAGIYQSQPKHYYQLTWEPNGSAWSSADIMAIYKSGYNAIHSGDPNAVVLGPTYDCLWSSAVSWHQTLASLGLSSYIDGVSIHPYFAMLTGPNVSGSELPETPGVNGTLVGNIRVLDSIFPGMPLFGTEQGFDTNGFGDATGGEDNELLQAESIIRENLIMLGEGYRVNMPFYISDIPGKDQDYGFYYNLMPGEPCGSSKLCPRPMAPAYAAQSFLLEGSTSDGVVPNLGVNQYGYIFQNGTRATVALWNNASTAQSFTLPVGVTSVNVYDWMGNKSTVPAVNGNATIIIGPQPVYVTGASLSALGIS